MTYYLADHVRACRIDNFAVFLDIRHDKYLAVSAPATLEIRNLTKDCYTHNHAGAQLEATSATWSELLSLKARGLIVNQPSNAAASVHQTLPEPSAELIRESSAPLRNPFRHIMGLLRASAKIAALLHIGSFERALGHIASRRQISHGSAEFEAGRARVLVSDFLALRPLFYTAKDHCLFDSLVLTEFLFDNRLFPWLVIGVALRPFRAHCWVQLDDIVFNSDPELARSYKPISLT
ncbi:MAG: lasso peptide biosynthesis B2 protein [Steroidobacteraceae bacterium]